MRFLVLTALLIVGASHSAGAQSLLSQSVNPSDVVQWTVDVEPDLDSPDSTRVLVTVSAKISGDWKMYAMDSPRPSRGVVIDFETLPDGVVADGAPLQQKPKRAYDQNFDMEVTYFQSAASFLAPFRIGSESNDADSLRGGVTYQVCSDSLGLCLPPRRHAFAVPVSDAVGCLAVEDDPDGACEVGPLDLSSLDDAGSTTYELAESPTYGGNLPSSPLRGRWGGFIALALAAGFGALLTPCVFPMIPLTVSYFAKPATSRRRSIATASVYGAAIIATFTMLGIAMAVAVGAAGAQTIAANPWVNLFIAAVLIGFALSLLGFFEIRLPNSLLNLTNRRSGTEAGLGGVLFMALTLTLVSFSCTAPFVGGLLAAAAGGSWLRPIVGMVAFSTAFASPFVVLAVFPSLLESLPRSGAWMNAVKVSLGFIELAAAIKFLSNADLVLGTNLISRPLAVAATVVILVLGGIYLIGRLRLPHEPRVASPGKGRMFFGFAFFAFALYLVPAILGAQRSALDPYFPPRRASDIALLAPERGGGDADEGWIVDDIDAAFAEASLEARPVFVDFSGYSCTNCRQMESSVFPNPAVAELLENDFVLLKLYTDGQAKGPQFQKYQLELTGTVALPTYAIVSPNRMLVDRVSGTLSVASMQSFLAGGASRMKRQQ